MSRERKYKDIIPRIYQRSYYDIALFIYVTAQKDIMPAISIEKALYNFFKRMCIEDFNIDSALTTYFRMQKEHFDSIKNEHTKEN
jgi:hypothetical protein